jgi:hypothetical protein
VERGDEILGHGFQLISRAEPALSQDQRDTLGRIGCTIAVLDDTSSSHYVEDVDGVYTAMLNEHAADAYITRPDWYVFGVTSASGLGSLVDELADRLKVVPAHRPINAVPAQN